MKKILSLLLVLSFLFTAVSASAESTESTFDLSTLNESQLLDLFETLKESLTTYGYILECAKVDNVSENLKSASEYPTDYGIVVSKCTWEANNGFYSPVIRVEVRNNTGVPSKMINLQVVFYNDDEASVWDEQSTYLISSSDTPLKNGFSKTEMLRANWGYHEYIYSEYLPNISYEIYINGIMYFDGIVEKPCISSEIESAISAAIGLKSTLINPNSIQVHTVSIENNASNPSIVLEISAANSFGGLSRMYYKCTLSEDSYITYSVYEDFILYKSDYKEIDASLVAPFVEE